MNCEPIASLRRRSKRHTPISWPPPASRRSTGLAEPVGVFELLAEDNPKLKSKADSTDLFVLLPHKSFKALRGFQARLQADRAYQKAGQGILDAPKTGPAYTHYDSLLLLAMEAFPGITVPAQVGLTPLRIADV